VAATPEQTDALLRLVLTPGLGPVLIRRAIDALGSPEAVASASAKQLRRIPRIGPETARRAIESRADLNERLDEERRLIERHGASLLTIFDDEYPCLLKPLPDAPVLLYVKGRLDPEADRFPVAMVGSRACTVYGVEQTERLAALLAQSGLTIVSGGARGIDTAAHRAALRVGGRTVSVLGCGLGRIYPPENADLFEQIAAGQGAVVSELPMTTLPAPDNFPTRNRIISGLCLGVLVVEAAKGSGALITAKYAAEEQGREVMAVPGRVDSPASAGCLELIKQGGAALVTSHADVIDLLESPARHLFDGVHADRYADPARPPVSASLVEDNLSQSQRLIVDTLASPMTLDELARRTGLDAATLRAETTTLEIRRVLTRRGDVVDRRRSTA